MKGGAIFATNGANEGDEGVVEMRIYDTKFLTNSATGASVSISDSPRITSNFSPIPGGPHTTNFERTLPPLSLLGLR